MATYVSDAITTKHGVDTARATYAAELAAASPVKVGIVDRGVNPSGNYVIDHRNDDKGLFIGNDGHASTCATMAARFAPELIHIVDYVAGGTGQTLGYSNAIDGVRYCGRPEYANCVSTSLSYEVTSGLGMNTTAMWMVPNVWAVVAASNMSAPLRWTDTDPQFDNVCGGYAYDGGTLSGYFDATWRALATETGAPSWAAPTISSGVAFLLLIKPSITPFQAMTALVNNAEVIDGVPWMRVDLAADAIMGQSSSSPQFFFQPSEGEEPTPTPNSEENPETNSQKLTEGESINMSITYPRPTGPEDRYHLLKISTGEILKYNVPYPRLDGGEIAGGDPDELYLHVVKGPRASDYDPRLFSEVADSVIDVENGTHTTTYSTVQRSAEEITEIIENMEAAYNAQVIENNLRDKLLLLGVGLALHQLDGQSLNGRQQALRTLIISKAVKLWKNDDVASQLKALVTGGSQPDLDAAPWEQS